MIKTINHIELINLAFDVNSEEIKVLNLIKNERMKSKPDMELIQQYYKDDRYLAGQFNMICRIIKIIDPALV